MHPAFSPVSSLLPIVGSDVGFPVRRIWCVARNYAEHAREMGGSGREAPFFFSKPGDAALAVKPGEVGVMDYPPQTADLHHELELVAAIGTAGRDIPAAAATGHIFGYAVGLDMTRRDVQAELKKLGRPWDLAKGFDQSAPLSAIVPAERCGHPRQGVIRLEVNGVERQRGDLADMIWSVEEIVAILSSYVELRPGDLVFTGTPAGVGPVVRGDLLVGTVAGVGELTLRIE